MDKLPEFRVTLTRLKPGEQAYPQGDDVGGRRTKLGGDPDWIDGDGTSPPCPRCGKASTFVAQIDSVEHEWPSNPHAVNSSSPEQKWMFADVGMIYVFFCFYCLAPHAHFECS